MIKKITQLFLVFFLFTNISNAGTPIGGQVSYRYLGNNKFEVTYKIYGDCQGIPLSIPDYTIRCSSSGVTKKLTATRIGVVNITMFCDTVKKKCTIGTPNIEEHTYMDTLDFNGSESSFKTCCIIQIGTGTCCRSGAITSGASGQDFWVFSTLDLCKAPGNSSPVFTFKPTSFESTNEILMRSFSAKDTIDKDSLSYSFTDPLTAWANKTSWSGGLDSKNPFTAFYPPSYNKALGPKPDLNPPYGIYLDPITGNLTGMPVSAESTIMAIAVKEWRKDGSGKYTQIGEIVIDQAMSFARLTNHQPSIGVKSRYNICEGETFILDLPTDDQPFTQTPPAPNLFNDTVTLSWDKGIKNASYSISNANPKLPAGKFEWKPSTGDSKKSPFIFSAIAVDNNCPIKGMTVKSIQLYVYPKINVSTSIKKINNSTYKTSINIANKNYGYVTGIFISSPTNVPDIRNYYFKSSGDLFSTLESDTIVFKKNGTYLISQTFLSETECNTKTLTDTLVVANLLEVNMGMTPLGTYLDTFVCKNQVSRIFAKVSNEKRPVYYTWKTGKVTKTDTLGYFDHSFSVADSLYLSVKDAAGQTNSTFRTVFVQEVPEINTLADISICPESVAKLKAKSKKTGQLTWLWYKNNIIIANADSIMVSSPGDYIVSATNLVGCSVFDTVQIKHFTPLKISLISGVYCQSKELLNQSEIIKDNPNPGFKIINWKLLKSLLKASGSDNVISDLLSDKNPNLDFDFTINISNSQVLWPDTYRDSLIFSAIAIDTNGCRSMDTMTVSLIKTPIITLSKKLIEKCINNSFNLDSFGKSGSNYKWTPFNRIGFANWPSLTPLANGNIAANYFSNPGKYKVRIDANNEFCVNSDSLLFTIAPLPRPIIGVIKFTNDIQLRDQSINEKSRKWYINDVFFSSDDSLLLTKTFIHLQPIKLEVTDNSDCVNDTTIIINTLIGINKIIRSSIEVYPNPANGILVLKQTDTWIPSNYEIYDVLGKKVISGITKNREEIIDLKNIQSGSYYLKYTTGEGIISIPFIKAE